jgi:hypothetical protein
VKQYSPTQLAVLRAIAARGIPIAEHRHLRSMTGRRVTWATMRVLQRDGLVVWNIIGATWWMSPLTRAQLERRGIL